MSKLREIFEYKRTEVSAAKSATPESELRAKAADAPPTLGFIRALESTKRDLGLIAEVKAASPSAGVIRPNFAPVDIARSYKRAGADCLSVLTDHKYFGGAPEFLTACKQETELPCLRKDFIEDPYQVLEARVWGADAILLIVAGLERSKMSDLQSLARDLGLDVLVEVHDEAELEIALNIKATFIGVNNRNLSTFDTDIGTSDRLLPMLPRSVHGVSESALRTRADLDRVKKFGARSVLIGTTFCASDDIEQKVVEVMGS